jgi:hypothetical protein
MSKAKRDPSSLRSVGMTTKNKGRRAPGGSAIKVKAMECGFFAALRMTAKLLYCSLWSRSRAGYLVGGTVLHGVGRHLEASGSRWYCSLVIKRSLKY